jgi:hypothetical protein
MLVAGVLPYDAALDVLSNPAPWTIAAMFIVMGALVRTGALDWFTQAAENAVAARPALAIGGLMAFVVMASALVSNTPVVVVMIPVFVQLARKLGVALETADPAQLRRDPRRHADADRHLDQPAGRRRGARQGLSPSPIFEVTPLGIVLVAWGMLYLRFVGPRLLPERDSMATLLSDRSKMKFFTEVAIPEDSEPDRPPVQDVELFKREGVRLIDVLRGDASLRRDLEGVTLQAGDRVVLRTEMAELLGLQQNKSLRRSTSCPRWRPPRSRC